MANESSKHSERHQQTQDDSSRAVERRDPSRELRAAPLAGALASPFTLMRIFMEDLDQLFEGVGTGANPNLTARGEGVPRRQNGGDLVTWIPAIEVREADGQLIVRADVPGMSKDQINVEIEDGQLIISGERKEEHEERQGGVYRSERVYGRFYRAIPLPEGVDPSQARATFNNGVLEITMPAPQRPETRRIEVEGQAQQGQPSQASRQQESGKPAPMAAARG